MSSPPLLPLTLSAADRSRAAAISGTRQLIADETFQAMCALLIASGAVPADDVRATVKRLAAKLTGYSDGHPEWRVHAGELALQARRLEECAERLG